MPFEIVYDIDYSPLFEIVKHIEQRLQQPSELTKAVQTAGDYTTQQWINLANSKFKHSQGGYVRGIMSGISYPYNGDPLHYRGENKASYAKALEEGVQSFDMKKALYTSDKVRITKDGKRYLVIPFRHGTPGSTSLRAMPQEIYEKASIGRREIVDGKVTWMIDENVRGAKNLRQSAVINTYKEGSIRGFKTKKDAELLRYKNPRKVIRNIYQWGDKLMEVEYPKLKESHKTSIYEGMVRFQTNPNINRATFNMGKFGGSAVNPTENMRNSSSYMTFRVMMEGAQGWIHPGISAMHILKDTLERVRQPIMQMMGEGAKKDVQAALESIKM